MRKLLRNLSMLAMTLVLGAQTASADTEWQTVWSTDFSTEPTGMTYSVSNGSVDISTGVLDYNQGGGSGNRAINTSFTDAAFQVDSDWKLEFDWGASSSNKNASNVSFATNNGTVFTITWAKNASTATITDASATELTTTLTIDGYTKNIPTKLSHFTIIGNKSTGITLTVTYGGTTVIDNQTVSTTFGYPATFNGSLGRAVSRMGLDNIVFQTPAVAGFVAAPTSIVTGANGTSRILKLASITEGATILWSETAPAAEDETYATWNTYNNSLTTSATIIYAVAKQDDNYSEVSTIETGAGTTIALTKPLVSVTLANGIPTYTFTSDNSSILGTPTATLSAQLNGTDVTLTKGSITPLSKGSLTVTASAAGYDDESITISVAPVFNKVWESANFSTLVADDVATVLGETWVKSEETGRWASWSSAYEPYTYYTDGGTENVTVQDNLLMRGVNSLVLGYGIGRNITGTETVTMKNLEAGYISSYTIYNGYGNTDIANNSSIDYQLCTETTTSSYVNYSRILVQAAMYAPADGITISLPTEYTYSTFSSTAALDFTNNSDVEAYTAKANGSTVTLKKVEKVPANTGLILKKLGDATTATVSVAESADAVADNDLVAVTTAIPATDLIAAGNAYILVNDNQFAKVVDGASGELAAGKAYLKYGSDKNNAPMMLSFGETTAIKGVEVKAAQTDNAIYNLQGVRVSKPAAKGLYIINGKKHLYK